MHGLLLRAPWRPSLLDNRDNCAWTDTCLHVYVCVLELIYGGFFFFNLYVFLFEFLPVFVHSFNKNACAPPVFWAVLADGGRGVESGMAPSGGRL